MIFITGFHHSGTSFLARAVEQLGFSFGEPLDRHHEHEAIKQIDDALCRELNELSGKSPRWGTASWTGPFKGRANMGHNVHDPIPNDVEAYKNPRLMVTARAWHQIHPFAKWVVITRDPHDVAISMMNDGGRPQREEFWIELQAEYKSAFLSFLQVCQPEVLWLTYQELCQEPKASARQLAEFLGKPEEMERLEVWLKRQGSFKTYDKDGEVQ